MADEDLKTSLQLARTTAAAVAEYGPALHRFLMQRLRNEHDVKDLMQEIFLRYWRIDRDTLVQDPKAYLFGIAFHVLSGFRTRARLNPVTFDSRAIECLPERADDIAIGAAEADALRHDLVRQLRRLPHAYREVLILRMESGLSYKDIAREMGISVNTVKKYLVNAKAWLRVNGS